MSVYGSDDLPPPSYDDGLLTVNTNLSPSDDGSSARRSSVSSYTASRRSGWNEIFNSSWNGTPDTDITYPDSRVSNESRGTGSSSNASPRHAGGTSENQRLSPIVLSYAPGPQALASRPSTSPVSVRTSSGFGDPSRPTVPVTYRFVHHTPTSMLVIPNGLAPESSPLYHISVVSNLFNPGVYITTIRRGGTEDGRYIGHFELDPTVRNGTLCVKGKEHKLKDIFTKSTMSTNPAWTWKLSRRSLKWTWKVQGWDTTKASASCFLEPQFLHRYDSHRSTDKLDWPPVANFTAVRRSDRPLPDVTLEVLPDGQEWFDHILISALILDRKRLKGEAPS